MRDRQREDELHRVAQEEEKKKKKAGRESGVETEARTVARGKAARTPSVLLASVAGVVWLFGALLSGVILLIWWLL